MSQVVKDISKYHRFTVSLTNTITGGKADGG